MLAPIDKVRNRGNDIIQIVITRKCDVHSCSNCTQLLPFRKDAKEMTLECVEEALLSVQGWPGVVACFGGNPCSHSRFPEVCALWKRLVPERSRGLWTNNLLRHGQVARDTFWPRGRFNLNVHGDPAAAEEMRRWLPNVPVYGESSPIQHAMMLGDRRDFGVSDEEWIALRERCDINVRWSSGVYQGADGRPKAYFCEVAGSLSGVRGEDNGILAEPGWWSWPMERFQDQVRTCCDRGCGVPLKARGFRDSEETYNVSASWKDATAAPAGRIRLEIVAERPPGIYENTDYIGRRKNA